MEISTEKGFITVDLNAENVIAWGMDDPDVFNPLRGLNENAGSWLQNNCGVLNSTTGYLEKVDTWVSDVADFSNPMKGILIGTPISLSLWALIILGLIKLF
jgi:hypothetical protein